MHIVFLNPQGNFDQNDSHMTEHPDFGGQLIYVKEVCMALAAMGHKVDIATRLIKDPEWPEFDTEVDYYEGYEENLRILRIPFGGDGFLRKELLWEHLDEYIENLIGFYDGSLPEFATTHYGDGGLSGVLLKKKTGLNFTFTGHSLGAQKLDKLGMDLTNYDEMESQFLFSRRIQAERLSMVHSYRIITSTSQERFEQYGHPLYKGAVDTSVDGKFSVIPPGVNTRIFMTEENPDVEGVHEYLRNATRGSTKPFVVVSSRLDEKKNHKGVLEAFASSTPLQEKANLAVVISGIDDPFAEISNLPEKEQEILEELLQIIKAGKLEDKVFFLNIQSQQELAASYRYFADLGSVFALTAFYEPFGLAPIEAAACGLPAVATKFGGPSEIFKDEKEILVDPFKPEDIARGLIEALDRQLLYAREEERLVRENYTWDRTAGAYLEVIEEGARAARETDFEIPPLDATDLLRQYLAFRKQRKGG